MSLEVYNNSSSSYGAWHAAQDIWWLVLEECLLTVEVRGRGRDRKKGQQAAPGTLVTSYSSYYMYTNYLHWFTLTVS